jgi:hypothetical protein
MPIKHIIWANNIAACSRDAVASIPISVIVPTDAVSPSHFGEGNFKFAAELFSEAPAAHAPPPDIVRATINIWGRGDMRYQLIQDIDSMLTQGRTAPLLLVWTTASGAHALLSPISFRNGCAYVA